MKLDEIGILDDIVGSFPDNQERTQTQHVNQPPAEQPRRTNISGQKRDQLDFPKYMSVDELDKLIDITSIGDLADAFAHYNVLLRDSETLTLSTDEIYKYREYNRNIQQGWTGKNTEEEYNNLKQDIQQNGIKEPVYIRMVRNDTGDVDVYLGEGNHRLKAAMDLGIKKLPVKILYSK